MLRTQPNGRLSQSSKYIVELIVVECRKFVPNNKRGRLSTISGGTKVETLETLHTNSW